MLILGQVIILLADIGDAVICQRIAVDIFQAITWQHHNRAVHTVGDVVRDHRTTRGTVICKATGLRGFPAQDGLFARIDVGQTTTAQRTS